MAFPSFYRPWTLRVSPPPPPPPLFSQCEAHGPPIGVGREKNKAIHKIFHFEIFTTDCTDTGLPVSMESNDSMDRCNSSNFYLEDKNYEFSLSYLISLVCVSFV